MPRRLSRAPSTSSLQVIDKIEADIIERDNRDMNREISPLKQADDATLIDSSYMSIDEVVDAVTKLIP